MRLRAAAGLLVVLSTAIGGCIPVVIDNPSSISFDGHVYQFQRPGRYLTLNESDLSEIGSASGFDHPYVDGTTVYAIRGLDSASAVAMRSIPGAWDDLGPMGEFIVLYVDDYPQALCQYEKEGTAQPAEGC